MGNHINYSIAFYNSIKNHHAQGNIRIVALIGDSMGDKNLEKLPKIQKFVPKMDNATQKFGFVMAPNTPTDKINHYNNILTKVLSDSMFKEQVEQDGGFVYSSNLSSQYFAKLAEQEKTLSKNQIDSMRIVLEVK